MRPLKGIVTGRGVVDCENGVTYRNLNIPTGIKHYDPVLVFMDMVHGCITSISADIPEETVAEMHLHEEVHYEPVCNDVLNDIVETDGSGCYGSLLRFCEGSDF